MATRLTHVALHVDAMDACIEFYQRYCKLEITNDQVRGGRRVVLMAEPGRSANFVLQPLAGGADRAPTPEDDRHLGFAAMAEEEGILLFETFEAPFPIGYLCTIKDPNGNSVEISCGHLLESEKQ